MLHSLLYMETALHVSGGTSTHHQEHKQLYLQHLVFVTPLLLSATIVEELELVWVCCGWRTYVRTCVCVRTYMVHIHIGITKHQSHHDAMHYPTQTDTLTTWLYKANNFTAPHYRRITVAGGHH